VPAAAAPAFDLVRSGRHRRNLVLGAAACVVVAVGALVLIVTGAGGGRTWIGRVSLLLVVLVLAGVAGVLVRGARAPAGCIELDARGVVITCPELLRRPLVLVRERLRTVLVDDGADSPAAAARPGRGTELAARFPLVEADGDAWLHPGARSAMPMLGRERAVPNVAVVLRDPWDLGSDPRRVLALLEGNEPLRALATCAGFFLEVADPAALAAALHERSLDPPLTLAEAEALDQRASDRRLRRRG
jgi:hypothetical protein